MRLGSQKSNKRRQQSTLLSWSTENNEQFPLPPCGSEIKALALIYLLIVSLFLSPIKITDSHQFYCMYEALVHKTHENYSNIPIKE